MKNFSIILVAFSIGTMPFLGEVPNQQAAIRLEVVEQVNDQKLGEQAVASIRAAYEKGDYDQFLKEMDDSYQSAKEKDRLADLSSMRSGFSLEWKEWEGKARSLQQEKNKELINAVAGQSKTLFVEKVRAAGASLTGEDQQKIIDKLASFRQMPIGSGKTADENLLIDLDLEYEYKALHLNLPGASSIGHREKHCVLKMEKLDRLLKFSKQFQDSVLRSELVAYAEHFDARLAQSWDMADLNQLANGKRKPANGLEEKVASILGIYQEKFSDLTRQFMAEHETPPLS